MWIDEFTDETNGEVSSDSESKISTSKEWAEAFCSDEEEVQMVRDSIIAIIYAFDPKQVLDRDPQEQAKTFKNYLDTQVSNILKFVDKLDQDMWDGISIAVAKTSPTKHTQERTAVIEYARHMFLDSGIEVVDMLNTGMKDGERQGLERVREILETHVALSGTAEEDEEEFQRGEQQSDDPLVNAIQEMLGDGTEGHQPFDTKQLDKTLAESGFAFPLLDGKNAGSVDRTGESDIAVGDMEQLANKIRLARSKYFTDYKLYLLTFYRVQGINAC